jgi:hypothetical protein
VPAGGRKGKRAGEEEDRFQIHGYILSVFFLHAVIHAHILP